MPTKIPITKMREEFQSLTQWNGVPDSRGLASIAALPGIHYLTTTEREFDCAEFVFDTVLGVDWFNHRTRSGVFADPVRFLASRRFQLLDRPKPNSVIAYCNGGAAKHWGMLDRDSIVVSKFGYLGPLVVHDLEAVPASYGGVALFFRPPGAS